MTSRDQGLYSNDQGRQRRETLGTRLCQEDICINVSKTDKQLSIGIILFFTFLINNNMDTKGTCQSVRIMQALR